MQEQQNLYENSKTEQIMLRKLLEESTSEAKILKLKLNTNNHQLELMKGTIIKKELQNAKKEILIKKLQKEKGNIR